MDAGNKTKKGNTKMSEEPKTDPSKPEIKEDEKKDAGAQGACGTGFYCGELVRYS